MRLSVSVQGTVLCVVERRRLTYHRTVYGHDRKSEYKDTIEFYILYLNLIRDHVVFVYDSVSLGPPSDALLTQSIRLSVDETLLCLALLRMWHVPRARFGMKKTLYCQKVCQRGKTMPRRPRTIIITSNKLKCLCTISSQ